MDDKELLTIIDQPNRVPKRTGRRNGNKDAITYAFMSLGCPKNLVDSERMLGLLQADGYRLVPEPDGADFVVVNTCGFIEAARTESLAVIDEMLQLKEQGRIRGVIVSGCLAERQKAQLLAARPGIDLVIGVFARDEVARVAERLWGAAEEQRAVFRAAPIRPLSDADRVRITPRHFAYVKISEGCDRLCTFCAIPKMRGKHATKPLDEVVREANQLAAGGVRELVVVAQDTTYYGMDLYGEPRLAELLRRLEQVDGIAWIRLMYLYPMHIDDALIETIAASPKIIPYLDLPLQHIDDEILRRMARRVTRRETEELLAGLRARIDALALRTTLITGFPSETADQFEALVDFVRAQRFERLGVFTYSFEPDTPSAHLPGHLPEEVKAERRDRLMAIQQQIAFDWNQAQIGKHKAVILDRAVPGESNVWIGRSHADAPDIDGVVYVTGGRKRLAVGDIVTCEIVAARDYDLIGVAMHRSG